MNNETNNFSPKESLISLAILIVAVVFIVFFFGGQKEAPEVISTTEGNKAKIFENLDLEARSLIVWDVKNQKEIFSKNSEAQLPLASLTKVMMALVALERSPEGTTIVVKNEHLSEEGDSGLLADERWRLRDLLDFSLIVSSNDGALAVASAIGSGIDRKDPVNNFIGLMNTKAQEIGLAQTYFISPSGLDKEDIIPGGNGSVKDMAILFDHVLKSKPEVFEATSYPELTVNSFDFLHEAENTNAELLRKLPGVVASKTGFTDLARGNLFVVFEPEPTRPIILGVIGSSLDGRFSDIEKLYLTTLDYINK